jgi:hypothetical protein
MTTVSFRTSGCRAIASLTPFLEYVTTIRWSEPNRNSSFLNITDRFSVRPHSSYITGCALRISPTDSALSFDT